MIRVHVTCLFAATALSVSAAAAQETTLSVGQSDEYGQYIVGPSGEPVYIFTTDTKGSGEDPTISCVSAECLGAWTLVIASGDVSVGPDLDETLVGSFDHEGKSVVTYNGWPLYSFSRYDAGQPPREPEISFGGEWHLIGSDGEKIDWKIEWPHNWVYDRTLGCDAALVLS